MNKYYPELFRRGKIGNREVKNRIFKPAAEDSCCGDGYVPDYLCDFYAEEARGGAGLIICGMYVVTPKETCGLDRHPVISDDTRVPGFGRMAQAIQDNGALACCQLGHFGSHGEPSSPDGYRCVSRAPLDVPGAEEWFTLFNMMYWKLPTPYPHKEYTVEEIRELVGYYGDAAVRAKRAGFDMVEVHAGHRHGLGCFLSPLTNQRTDAYGGSVQKRARILYEVVEDIQKKCGKDFPIIVRMNGRDGEGLCHYQDGITKGQQVEDTVAIAKHLEEMGVAALDISIQDTNVPMQHISYGVAVQEAAEIKKVVHIPVLTAGSVKAPDFAEQVLEKGEADFVGTARQMYADPDWPVKAMRGETEEIKPCIRCMECVNVDRHQWAGPMCCSVNPAVGKPYMRIRKAAERRKVAVVGGGPAGMEAARVLALRGHDVTLFEKRKLGGMMNEGSVPDFKADIRRLMRYYENQMNELPVRVQMQEASLHDLEGFDAVVAATGSNPVVIRVPGYDRANVHVAVDVLGTKPSLGQHIVIIGGGSVGVETAIYLAKQGKAVSIVEMRDRVLMDEMAATMIVDMGMIAQFGIQVLTGETLQSIDDGGVHISGRDGTETILPADDVIMAAGLRANRALRDELDEKTTLEVYAAGDTNRPRKIYDAIHEGYTAAMSI